MADLPNDKVLFVGANQCPFCKKPGTLEYSDPEYSDNHPQEITRAVHCEDLECDVHFVTVYVVSTIQVYTDESLRFERCPDYTACPLEEVEAI